MDDLIKSQPGKYIDPKVVGTEADNILNSIFGEKLKARRYVTDDMKKTLIESWQKEILPRFRSYGIKISNWKDQCFSQVGLQVKS